MREIRIFDRLLPHYTIDEIRPQVPKEVLSHCLSYSFEEDKLNSRTAYALVLKRIKEKGRKPSPVHFTESGKPYRDSVFFSISHSQNRIAIRISDKECGIDIQKVDYKKNFDSTAKRVLNGREYGLYLTREDKPSFFTSCWVRKEAYLKRIGTGITSLSGLKKIDENLAISSILDSEGNKYYYSYIDI